MAAPRSDQKPQQTVIDGRWRLDKPIGEGGMGMVWLGRDLQLDRAVAVKVLSEDRSREPEFVDRFVREAQLLSRLNHPNIVTLYGVGRHQGRPFLVMRFLKGQELGELMDQPIPLPVALPLLRQLCAGLGAMHQSGILHRDIKPANLLVSEAGHLTILDLGIARPGDSSLTKTGVVYGTIGYMSPEQMLGEKSLDARSDVYSVGVVAFEMLTSQMPFSQTNDYVELFKRMNTERPDLLALAPNLPPALSEVLAKSMASERDDRQATTAELWKELERAAKAAGPGARKAAPPPQAAPPSKRRSPQANVATERMTEGAAALKVEKKGGGTRWALILVALLVLAGAAGAAFVLMK